MRTRHIAVAILFTSSAPLIAQGPLQPPGPPAATMKALDQLEPRRPISSLPFTISEPGSYYVTANLHFTAPAGHAITITASDVTLDLMGFTLSSSSEVTGDAIRIDGGIRNVGIKNGAIVGNTTVTRTGATPNFDWAVEQAGFAQGIRAGTGPQANDCYFSQLRISRCRTIGLAAGQAAVVEQVSASENGTAGISAVLGSVTNSTARNNGGVGINVDNGSATNCIASANRGVGISADAGSVANSTATGNSIGFDVSSGTVTNCRAGSNGGTGISAHSGTVVNSVARSNGGDGISVNTGVVAFCKASSNNTKNNDSVDIRATGSTQTGNNSP